MKRVLAISVMVLLATGCGRWFSVIIKDDPFVGGTTVSADMWHKVIDGNLDNIRALYTKVIKKEITTIPELKLDFRATIGIFQQYYGEKLERQLYLVSGDKIFKVNFADTTFSKQQHNYSSSSTSTSSDGIRASSSSGSYESVFMSGIVKITPDIQKAILEGNNFLIRVYTGKTATNMEATPAQLKALKNFLEVNAKNYKQYIIKDKK